MMMEIFSELQTLCDKITARGIPATLDPRNLEVPGALVDIDTIDGDTDQVLCGQTTATATVYLVTADNGRPETLASLLTQYDKVRDLTNGASPIDLALPSLGTLPALRLNPIPIGD